MQTVFIALAGQIKDGKKTAERFIGVFKTKEDACYAALHSNNFCYLQEKESFGKDFRRGKRIVYRAFQATGAPDQVVWEVDMEFVDVIESIVASDDQGNMNYYL